MTDRAICRACGKSVAMNQAWPYRHAPGKYRKHETPEGERCRLSGMPVGRDDVEADRD